MLIKLSEGLLFLLEEKKQIHEYHLSSLLDNSCVIIVHTDQIQAKHRDYDYLQLRVNTSSAIGIPTSSIYISEKKTFGTHPIVLSEYI